MSICSRCGASFGCAMADQLTAPCWCVVLAPVVPMPGVDASCWCPACLMRHIDGHDNPAQQAAPLLPVND